MPTGTKSLFFFSAIPSITALVVVARPAEHLQVIVHGTPALAPRRDMVALHILKLEMLTALGINEQQYTTCVKLSNNWSQYSDWYKSVYMLRPEFTK